MSSILKTPSHVAQIGYNGFNMEQTVSFTSAPFMLLPIYYDFLNPGDKVRANAFGKLRTMPLAAPAEFKATVRYDWFAVPVEQIFKYFGNLYYNISDFNSDFIPSSAIEQRSFANRMPYGSLVRLDSYWRSIALDISQSIFDTPDDYVTPEGDNSPALQLMKVYDMVRILDCLGVQSSSFINRQVSSSISPLLFCAYQKIYMDWYRLSDREVNDPVYFNLDSYTTKQGSNLEISQSDFMEHFCKLRYAPYNKDFFMNVFVSPLQGAQDIGSAGLSMQQFNTWLSDSKFFTGKPDSTHDYGLDVTETEPTSIYVNSLADGGESTSPTPYGQFNVSNIHALFAMEKALEITRRAGKHYDAQTLAHWGVTVPQGLSGEVIYLGSQTQPFIVGQVTSTAASGDEPLGTLAGQGYSDSSLSKAYNKPIIFEAKGHTILMCVYSVIPEVDYTQRGIDKINAYLNWSDFVHPEYDNLGMQPLFRYQASNLDSQAANEIIGWQYSFSELKLKYNRVFAGVHRDGTLHYWIPQRDLDDWASYTELTNFVGLPTYFNDILVQPYTLPCLFDVDGSTHLEILKDNWYQLIYSQDPFINSVDFSIVKSSKMSKYGLQTL